MPPEAARSIRRTLHVLTSEMMALPSAPPLHKNSPFEENLTEEMACSCPRIVPACRKEVVVVVVVVVEEEEEAEEEGMGGGCGEEEEDSGAVVVVVVVVSCLWRFVGRDVSLIMGMRVRNEVMVLYGNSWKTNSYW
jgi:hypothetical protein